MKSYAKINVFLKIVGTRGVYHEIFSRFVRFDGLFDELSFESSDKFSLESNVKIDQNIILKAKNELEKAGFKNELDDFFKNHKIVLYKNIPMGGGLGGGSSNAATFLKLANSELNLKISVDSLAKIGARVGSDVPFFIYDFIAANVSGIGEIVEEFGDEVPNLELFYSDIFCSTPEIYAEFRNSFIQNINLDMANKFLNLKSNELLRSFRNYELNDLFLPCTKLYKNLSKKSEGRFLSGSGSTMFGVID